ncbi:MAG: hypothetical protein KME31_22110 [Tolypothrix carrinoi HA7290-LM1]|nr:hypothetical protein [Tolypothrix carrinoi HA7290-LM1]
MRDCRETRRQVRVCRETLWCSRSWGASALGGSADSHAPGVETTAGAVACGTRPPHCLPLAERLSLWEKTALLHQRTASTDTLLKSAKPPTQVSSPTHWLTNSQFPIPNSQLPMPNARLRFTQF